MGFLKNLFGKKEEIPSLDLLGTDIHSHLIPGIDDGAQKLSDSLEMIRGLYELGFRKCITTPHVMSDAYRNTPETILGGLEKLRAALVEAGIDMELEAAAEYYLDEIFLDKIGQEDLLTFGGDQRYLLFETSYVSRPMSLERAIFELQAKGYTPVLAHPERYQYFWDLKDIAPVAALRERGALLQVNITSFAGTRGKRASWIANELCRAGLVDFVGTDIHRAAQLEVLRRAAHLNVDFRQLLASQSLRNLQL